MRLIILFVFLLSIIIPTANSNSLADVIKTIFDNAANNNLLLIVKNKPLIIPIQGFTITDFLQNSILHIPKDIIRDGLPWFHSKRDDWNNKKTRWHLGIDIYCKHVKIISPATGVVEKIGKNTTAGKWMKINHGNGVKTVYVHLSKIYFKKDSRVDQGDIIGQIDKPEGNAIETQLHFELEINGVKVDPIPFIEKTFKNNPEVIKMIKTYRGIKKFYESERAQDVKKYLQKKRKK